MTLIRKVIGIDPGVTTGICVCLYKRIPQEEYGFSLVPVHHEEIVFHDNFFFDIAKLLIVHKPQIAVMESVVQSGHLSREKVVQIRAHDRTLTAARDKAIELKEVQPQAVKRVTFIPSSVKGNHARDAYRIMMAYFAGL